MFFLSRSHFVTAIALALFLSLFCATAVRAQEGDDFGDDGADPIQLFKRGQEAHARGDFQQALSLYDAALKSRPDFPEALLQKGNALVSLTRYPEAEKSFQRAVELRDEWALPKASLGALLVRMNRLDEAGKYLEGALALEPANALALSALADLYLRTKKTDASSLETLLKKLVQATAGEDPPASLWVARATLEKALGKKEAAELSLNHALTLDPRNVGALMERSDMLLAEGNLEGAIQDARTAQQLSPQSLNVTLFLAHTLARAGKPDEALKVLDELDAEKRRQPEVVALRKTVAGASMPETEDRAELEALLEKQPRNAPLLVRLCILYRADDATRAADYCRRALEIEPTNPDYATAYGAALVRAKQYPEAISLLRQVVMSVPDNYAAHANLATALYEMKRYQEALVEYEWIIRSKPDLAVAYYFMATAYDHLSQFQLALAAYEKFLEKADPKTNQLEIDKVKLRLPTLRKQIQRGEGVKNKKG